MFRDWNRSRGKYTLKNRKNNWNNNNNNYNSNNKKTN